MRRGNNERTQKFVRKGIDVLSVSSGPSVSKTNRFRKQLDRLLNTTTCISEETDIELLWKRLFEVYKMYENLSWFSELFIGQNTETVRTNRLGLHSLKPYTCMPRMYNNSFRKWIVFTEFENQKLNLAKILKQVIECVISPRTTASYARSRQSENYVCRILKIEG